MMGLDRYDTLRLKERNSSYNLYLQKREQRFPPGGWETYPPYPTYLDRWKSWVPGL